MDLIRKYEEFSFAQWPSCKTLFIDSWVVRLSSGYTKRANCVNIIYGEGLCDFRQKIEQCESIFTKCNIKPTFKLTKIACPENIDSYLDNAGYTFQDVTHVMIADIKSLSVESKYDIYNNPDPFWVEQYKRIKKLDDGDTASFISIMSNSYGDIFHVALRNDENDVVAIGTGVVHGKYLGILNVQTEEEFRGRGFGRAIMNGILREGEKRGALYSYLQVFENNTHAVKLYNSLGFKTIYDYWYRVKT